MATLAKLQNQSVVLMGDEEIVFRCPPSFKMEMIAGARVSLFPMTEARDMVSMGLKWPLDGITLKPDGLLGTSNEATGGEVAISIGTGALLAILPLSYLNVVIGALLD